MTAINPITNKLMWAQLFEPKLKVASIYDDGNLDESHLQDCVSKPELIQASNRQQADERRHFLFRRCFQRAFVAEVIGWHHPLNTLNLVHGLDQPPSCLDAQEQQLSFSSSGNMFLAASFLGGEIGADIEKIRVVENPLQIAERFFSTAETAHLNAVPTEIQSQHFLLMWTAKEAGLKAIGKGIVDGINIFTLSWNEKSQRFQFQDAPGAAYDWNLRYLDFCPGYIVAVVNKVLKSAKST